MVSQQPIPAVHWIHWLLLWDDCFHSGGVGPCGTHFLDQGDEGKGCPCSTVLSGAGTTRSSLRYACCYPGAARVYSPSPEGDAAPTRQGRDTTGNMAVRCGKLCGESMKNCLAKRLERSYTQLKSRLNHANPVDIHWYESFRESVVNRF